MIKPTAAIKKKKPGRLLTPEQATSFRKKVYAYYRAKGRDLPWRRDINPYRVLISEIMLQQTQVERVIKKYSDFLSAYPDFPTLADASLPKLFAIWSGMGYNRRALALRTLAQKVMAEHHGRLPSEPELLIALPGIGKYTAGAVSAFAFNKPVVFMDTNIRRVYIHEFLHDQEHIHDDELIPLVEQTIDKANPRKWYNALMDYGTMLKQKHANPNRKSAHYVRQSPFENSNRQVRGKILKLLVAQSPLTTAQIIKESDVEPERIRKNLAQLADEGFIAKKGIYFSIS